MNAADYIDLIAAYDKEFKPWESRGKKILDRYRDDKRKSTDGARFNVLWSNVQTLKAATYSRTPRPDVSRRFKDNDPVARVASQMLERALDFEVRNYPDFALSMLHVVYDRFLPGRGTAWVRYEPILKQEPVIRPEDDTSPQVTDDAPDTVEVLDFEAAPVDYVHWTDFGHNVARTWEEVWCVWRAVYMDRQALVDRFGEEVGGQIPLDSVPEEQKTKSSENALNRKGLIYEIWDKNSGNAVWLSKSKAEIVDEQPDPLELEQFFPCPRPIYATLTTDTLVPVPDFALYQDQAKELDLLSDRIQGLIKQLQIKGVYDASVPSLKRLFSEGQNGDLIPVENWAAFAEKKGLGGAIDIMDILPTAQALTEAYKAFEQVKAQIYELTGVSDVMRGQTNANETATAQKIKNSYGSLRLKVYQDEVERFAAEILKIKAEIICSKFTPDTVIKMSGAMQLMPADQQLVPQALELLKSDPMRNFRVEVETDSMAYQDEQQEKSDRMEFLKATSDFIAKIVQASEMSPDLGALGGELLKFGVTGFRVGKSLEGTIDEAVDRMNQMAKQNAANPKPDPEQMKIQAEMQGKQAEMQANMQLEGQKMQATMQMDQARAQADFEKAKAQAMVDTQLEQAKMQAAAAQYQAQCQHEANMKQMELQAQSEAAAQQQNLDWQKAQLEADTKVIVAQMQAEAGMRQAAMSAQLQPTTDDEGKTEAPDNVESALTAALDGFKEAVATMKAPKKVIRDASGQIMGVE